MGLPYVPAIEDPTAEHQIVIRKYGANITVSCNCLRRAAQAEDREIIEERSRWTTPEALNSYREWHWVHGIDLYGPD